MKHLVSLIAGVALLVACGGPLKYQMVSTNVAPGADGRLVADVMQEQKQTKVTLEVTHLAPPNRVSPETNSYVVWYRGDAKTPWIRVGALKYDEGDRSGEFEGTVPVVAFDFEVSAENVADSASPSASIVFSQRVQK